jgi:transcription antitermination factor NusB
VSPTPAIPDAVVEALGYDRATDAFSELDCADLPRTLPLYVPTIVGGVDDEASARHLGDVLLRSLPETASVDGMSGTGVPDERITTVRDLGRIRIDHPTWIHIPASDVRVEAIGALYAADVLGADEVDVEALSRRATALATATWDSRVALDERIAAAAEGWRIDRMTAVDRNILRLGAYELLHTDLATGIVIDRAVEIAKRFSTARSGPFVNGILDTIAADRLA